MTVLITIEILRKLQKLHTTAKFYHSRQKFASVNSIFYSIPENQEQYGSIYPVMKIDEVPFGYAIEGNRLKLHYHGMYLCDHIPATFVFKRIR